MKFDLKNLFKKKTTEDNPLEQKDEIIVPQHAKKPEDKVKPVDLAHVPIVQKKESQKNIFVVNGNYDIGNSMMLSGVMQSGSLSKGMKHKKDGMDLTITDIKIGSDKVKDLNLGEEGAIFVKGKNTHLVKYDDELEFK
ncbi:MAG: hypothetical protein AABW59_00090 [archaeon]